MGGLPVQFDGVRCTRGRHYVEWPPTKLNGLEPPGRATHVVGLLDPLPGCLVIKKKLMNLYVLTQKKPKNNKYINE